MRIEHIAMYVNDLERAKNFFCGYFGAVPGRRVCCYERSANNGGRIL